jgi:hypothetical protein
MSTPGSRLSKYPRAYVLVYGCGTVAVSPLPIMAKRTGAYAQNLKQVVSKFPRLYAAVYGCIVASPLAVSAPSYQGGHVSFTVTGPPGDTVDMYLETTSPVASSFENVASYPIESNGTGSAGFSLPENVVGQTYPATYSGYVYFVDTTTGQQTPQVPFSVVANCDSSGCTFTPS